MQEVEKEALQTSPVQPKWWRRYVDDANACLKKSDIQCFHNHLNSINRHIQFITEMPSVSDEGQNIPFLDTNCKICPKGNIEVDIYQKETYK